MKCLVFLIASVFATEHNTILVKIEEDEYDKVETADTSRYIGVSYTKRSSRWIASRWSKKERKNFYNGSYKDEEIAAYASDTLARKLMANGEQNHKINFPDDDTEVRVVETNISKYIGVSYNKKDARWQAYRWSKKETKNFYNGSYNDEETAAHASDTLARKLMENGEQNHKLNLPDDDTETYLAEKPTTSKYIGVYYCGKKSRWIAQRRKKKDQKMLYNGAYKTEESAAHASDTLAKKLMQNCEHHYQLNFPDDDTEACAEKLRKNKRRRSHDLDVSETDGKVFDK